MFKRKQKKAATNKPLRIGSNANQQRFLTDELEAILNGWQVGSHDIDSVIEKYQRKMVMRAREQHRKNDYVKRYFQLLKTNVIGPDGIIMHGLIEDKQGLRNKQKNAALERAWSRFQQARYCDVSGQLDFIQMQQLLLTTVAQDGEAIVRLIRDLKNPFGLSLQLIDPQRLDLDKCEKLKQGRFIRHGIEFESTGKVRAYYFLEQDSTSLGNKKKRHQRIDANEIIHLFRSEQVGQKRGLPWVSTALFRMKMLDSYQDAAIINANAAAKKIAFFQKKFNDSADVDPTPLIQNEHIGYGIIPAGYDLVPFDSQYPNGEIELFTKSILRGISSGLGISYNSLATDLEGVNFSSLRHGAIEERDGYKVLQRWFINAFLTPFYERWLESALLLNAIPGLTLADFDDCLSVRFQARRWQWVDPAKEMSAFEKKLSLGLSSRADVIRETGQDPDEVFNQIKHEQDLFKAEGLSFLLHPENIPPVVQSDNLTPAKDKTANDDDTTNHTKT